MNTGEAVNRYRDDVASTSLAFEARRPHMEQLFSELDGAGIGRDDLYLAWDFTVASQRAQLAEIAVQDLQDRVVEDLPPPSVGDRLRFGRSAGKPVLRRGRHLRPAIVRTERAAREGCHREKRNGRDEATGKGECSHVRPRWG